MTESPVLRTGRVIANHGQTLLVACGDAEPVTCIARKSAGPAVCGDRVEWLPQEHGPGVITGVLLRTTLLSRPDARGKPRLLCANIDQVVVTGAIRPDATGTASELAGFQPELIDSYLAAAEILGLAAIVSGAAACWWVNPESANLH